MIVRDGVSEHDPIKNDVWLGYLVLESALDRFEKQSVSLMHIRSVWIVPEQTICFKASSDGSDYWQR